jgi:hypothetical protein
MTARSSLAERERAQVRAARGGLSHVTWAEGLEDGRAAVVHAGDHRRRATLLREAADDGRGSPHAEAEATDVLRADSAQEAGGGEGVHCSFGKYTLSIDGRGVRSDDTGADLFER